MRQIVITALEHAVASIKDQETLMPLSRWNESVFRFVYSQAVARLAPDVAQLFEASRIDLVLDRPTERAFIELKFYTHAVRYDPLSGEERGMKGHPGAKNRREFDSCVDRLRHKPSDPETLKVVALFYADPLSARGMTYEMCYGNNSGIEEALSIRSLISVVPVQFERSRCICSARLFEVGARPRP